MADKFPFILFGLAVLVVFIIIFADANPPQSDNGGKCQIHHIASCQQ